MNVLMISGDEKLLDPASDAGKRLALQRTQVERLDVFAYRGFGSALSGAAEVAQAVLRTHYDVITAQEPFARGLLAWLSARACGARLNVQVHANLARQPLLKWILARFVLRRADSIRVVSRAAAVQLEPLQLHARVVVLPVFIDVERFKNLLREPAGPRATILWVGRFEDEKGPLLALDVFRQVHAAEPSTALVMLGTGSLAAELRQRAEGLPVEFPGWQDPAAYLPRANLVLSTSRHESYGASIIEALAAGVPVVAPEVGVAREAGAVVAERAKLTETAIETLRSGARGALRLALPDAQEWAKRWKESLI